MRLWAIVHFADLWRRLRLRVDAFVVGLLLSGLCVCGFVRLCV